MGIFSVFKSKETESFPWIELTSSDQLRSAIESATDRVTLIFKHSTRCSISSMAKSRFESKWNISTENIDLYLLDLIAYREISNEIADITGIIHQSPQVIVLKNKEVLYTETHSNIDANVIQDMLSI